MSELKEEALKKSCCKLNSTARFKIILFFYPPLFFSFFSPLRGDARRAEGPGELPAWSAQSDREGASLLISALDNLQFFSGFQQFPIQDIRNRLTRLLYIYYNLQDPLIRAR